MGSFLEIAREVSSFRALIRGVYYINLYIFKFIYLMVNASWSGVASKTKKVK